VCSLFRVCVRRFMCLCTRWHIIISTCHTQPAGMVAPFCENFYIGRDVHSHEHLLVRMVSWFASGTFQWWITRCVQMVLTHDCDVVIEYLVRTFRRGQRNILVHVFRALATVLFENAGRAAKVTCTIFLSPFSSLL